jgi:hypothetical protein
MPVHRPTPGAIVVVTGEDDRFAVARETAAGRARRGHRAVILYDWDAASILAEPLPTWWSSDGWNRRFPDRLDPEQLDALGRSSIADQVRDLRDRGLVTFAWLPSDHGPGALAEYAAGQRADVIVIPRDLEELSGFDALVNGTARPADELEQRAVAEIVIA